MTLLRTIRRWGTWALLSLVWVAAFAQTPPAGVQSLDDGWSYHQGDDPHWAQLELKEEDWTALPSLRQHHALEPCGLVWFRRKVQVPQGGGPQEWALAFGRAFAAVEIYVDGRQVGSSGDLGPPPEGPQVSGMKAYAIPPPRRGNVLTLAIRTNLPRDYRRMEGGVGSALGWDMWIGPAALVKAYAAQINATAEAERLAGDQSHWALVIVFVMMGLFHLQLFSRRREARYYLWFGLVALSMGLREAAMTEWAIGPFGHPFLTFWASWFFLLSSSPPFIQFLWPFLGRPIPAWLKAYQLSFLIPALALFLPLEKAIPVIRTIGPFWGLPSVLLAAWVVAAAAWKGVAEARTIAFGMLMIILGGLYELGYWLNWWPYEGTLSLGFAIFLGSMAVSVSKRYARAHAQTEALNRTLEQRVLERTAELEEAQARVHRLTESSRQALRDPGAWCEAMAAELALSLDARAVRVWRVQRGQFSKLTAHAEEPPDLRLLELMLHESATFTEGEDVVLPVAGMAGDLRAAVVVQGKNGPWSGTEQRLVETFANQLGGALELSRMRAEVETATQRRAATRQALIEQGNGLLQVCPFCHRCYDETLDECAVDQSPLDASRIFPSRIASRYRLTRLLGEGAMGLVFEAEDERLRRRVALKAIKPENFNSQEKRFRFEQEARSLAQIHHPSVIAIYDSGELEDGTIYLVTERLVGATLRTLMDAFGPGTPAQVGSLLLQCGEALDAVHAAGLLHRDIKPDNIFAIPSPDGLRFKLLDFGLAKEMAVDSTLTQTGVVIGTPLYMSPEQIRDEALDSRSDLYALAVVAYEALSGRRAVQSHSLPEILVEVAQRTPQPLRELVPGLPPKIAAAFDQAFAKEPWRRPANLLSWAEQLAKRLLILRLERHGWPKDLKDVPASGFSASDSSKPPSFGAVTLMPGRGDEDTQALEMNPRPGDDV